jgi:glycosyltransferase involved in cell wall biosynthesis
MRILVMLNNFPWPQNIDGIFNWMQLRALRELGHEIRIVRSTPWAPPLRAQWRSYGSIPGSYVHDGFHVRTYRVFMGPKNFGLGSVGFQLRQAIAREVMSFAPEVVQVHGLVPAGVLALEASVPYVLTGHGSETYRTPFVREKLRSIAEVIVARAAACVGVSQFVADRLHALGAEHPRVIFNGADDRVFFPRNREAARAELHLDPLRPTVLYVGDLVPAKGMAELQEAAIALRDLRPQFLFAGSGGQMNALRESLQRANVSAHFYGTVSHAALAPMFAAADVVALPSHAEGLPVALCEAMCAGRAIVATRVGGIPEIVRDGVSGYTVEAKDTAALVDRLRRILVDAALRDSFENAGLAFAQEHLTWKANALAYDELYRSVTRPRAALMV